MYNANNHLFSKLSDFAHKIVSPQTYQCSLCKLTYGNFTTEKEWEKFIKSLPYEVQFSYKNEFIKSYPNLKHNFPALYLISNNTIELIIDSKEINAQTNLDELILIIKKVLLKH